MNLQIIDRFPTFKKIIVQNPDNYNDIQKLKDFGFTHAWIFVYSQDRREFRGSFKTSIMLNTDYTWSFYIVEDDRNSEQEILVGDVITSIF